jgi:hypothetical protein
LENNVAVELCAYLDSLALIAAETYRKVDALERVVKQIELTKGLHREAEGLSDAGERLASLTARVAGLRVALNLPPTVRPVLPEKPEPPDVSFLRE